MKVAQAVRNEMHKPSGCSVFCVDIYCSCVLIDVPLGCSRLPLVGTDGTPQMNFIVITQSLPVNFICYQEHKANYHQAVNATQRTMGVTSFILCNNPVGPLTHVV